MTISTEDHALLAQDSYKTHQIGSNVTLGNVTYKVLDETHNRLNGYQGTAYLRVDTGELVVAHCGTDTKRMKYQDIATDAGMVLAGVNAQTPSAMSFTKEAIEKAKAYDANNHLPYSASVTGHSLGGALAEITAYKYGLPGETFNGYGAAGLLQGIPQGGNQVIDHVRATDVVSAASKHFGEVKTYAMPQDIEKLNKAGYHDDMGKLSLRNPVKGVDLDAHGMDNFTPDNPRLGHSLINPQSEALYEAHKGMIDRYRGDVLAARTVVSAQWEIPKAIGEGTVKAGRAVGHGISEGAQAAEHLAHRAYDATRDKVVEGAQATERGVHRAYDATRDKVVEGAQATERGVHRAYDATRSAVSQGVHATEHKVSQGFNAVKHAAGEVASETSRVAHAVEGKAAHAFDKLSHLGGKSPAPTVSQGPHAAASASSSELLDRLKHTTEAFKSGDKQAFQKGVHEFANMEPGRNLQAHAVAAVNKQEQAAHETVATQAKQAQQVQQPAPQQGHSPSR